MTWPSENIPISDIRRKTRGIGMTELNERDEILAAIGTFMGQKPGLEFGNYGDVSAYRSEMRSITKDLHHARQLLRAVSWRESITADNLKEAFRAFSGRLSWDSEKKRLDYCTGQYFPTEYRKAVCAVLASALWDFHRECMPKGYLVHNSETGETFKRYQGQRAGDWIRGKLRKEYGHAIASRYFN